MDWYDGIYDLEEKDLASVEDALRQFFSCCPSVQRLNIMIFPSQILSEFATSSQIKTVATYVMTLSMFHTVMNIASGKYRKNLMKLSHAYYGLTMILSIIK